MIDRLERIEEKLDRITESLAEHIGVCRVTREQVSCDRKRIKSLEQRVQEGALERAKTESKISLIAKIIGLIALGGAGTTGVTALIQRLLG